MSKQKKLKKCTHPHYCLDWDDMFIFPGDPEFACCLCKCREEDTDVYMNLEDHFNSSTTEEYDEFDKILFIKWKKKQQGYNN